jgi:hypothetical protein
MPNMSGLRQPKFFNHQEKQMEKHTKIRTAFILLKKLLEVQQLILDLYNSEFPEVIENNPSLNPSKDTTDDNLRF